MKTLTVIAALIGLGLASEALAQSARTGASRQGMFGQRTVGGPIAPRTRTWAFGPASAGVQNGPGAAALGGPYQGRNMMEAIGQYARQVQAVNAPQIRPARELGRGPVVAPPLRPIEMEEGPPTAPAASSPEQPGRASTPAAAEVPTAPAAATGPTAPAAPAARLPFSPTMGGEETRRELPTSLPERSEPALSARLRRALNESNPSIAVSMRGETAILRGVVADEHQRGLAERLIALEPGVLQVQNELTVGGTARRNQWRASVR